MTQDNNGPPGTWSQATIDSRTRGLRRAAHAAARLKRRRDVPAGPVGRRVNPPLLPIDKNKFDAGMRECDARCQEQLTYERRYRPPADKDESEAEA